MILTLGHLALGQGVAAGTSGNCSAPGGSVIIARGLAAGEHSAAAGQIVVDASYSETADGRIQLDGWSSIVPIDAVIIRTGPLEFELPGGQSGGGFVPPDGFSITQIRWCASTAAVPPTTISPPKDPGPVLPPAPTTTVPSPTTTVPSPPPTTSTTLPPTTTTLPDPGSTTTTAPTTTTTAPVVPAPEPGGTTTTAVSTTTTTVGDAAPNPPTGPASEQEPGSADSSPDDADGLELVEAEPTTTSTTAVASASPEIVRASPPSVGETPSDPDTTTVDVVAAPLVPAPVSNSVELFSRMTTPQQVLVGAGLGVGGVLSGIGVVRRIRMPKLP